MHFLRFFFCCLLDRFGVCSLVDSDVQVSSAKQPFRCTLSISISLGTLMEEQFFVGLLSQDEQNARPCALQISFWHCRTSTMFYQKLCFSSLAFNCSFYSRTLKLYQTTIIEYIF